MSIDAFRNVVALPHDPVEAWPFEALAEIRLRPWGSLARRVLRWTGMAEGDPAARLFTIAIDRARQRTEDDERAEVTRQIREAITASGMTAAEFAAGIGTSASRLSTYASGRVVPSATMLLRIRRRGHTGSRRAEP